MVGFSLCTETLWPVETEYFWRFTEKVCQTLGYLSTVLLLMEVVEGKGQGVISDS